MNLKNFIKNHKSILCLNGKIPNKNFFSHNIPVIATDGAADKLLKKNVIPDKIIGDMDSLKTKNLWDKSKLIIDLDQNRSDFEKSLSYVTKNKLIPTLITGVSGGFLDQIIENLNIISKNKCNFYDNSIIGTCLEEGDCKIYKIKKNTKISFFALPEAIISTKGLKWNLLNEKITFPGKNSISNRSILDEIEIEITKGKILLIIYLKEVFDAGYYE